MDSTSSLIERIREGSLAAFHQVFERYYDLMCNYSLMITSNQAIAEEVADDVLFQLWKNRSNLHIDNLEHYLLRSTRNRSVSALKEMWRQHEVNESVLPESLYKERLNMLADNSTPLDDMVLEEFQQRIDEAISRMPPAMQRVYRLSREEDLSYAQIAETLNISINTVKYQMKAALAVLAKNGLGKKKRI